jgi:hypothetical protein
MSTFFNISFTFYLIILILINYVGFKKYCYLDEALRVFVILMFLTLINELISFTLQVSDLFKAPLSHVFSIFELSLLIIFYLKCRFKQIKPYCEILAFLVASFLGLTNFLFFQSLFVYNSYMIMTESVIITSMALLFMFDLLKRDELTNVFSNTHFRIWVSELVLWSSMFFYWAFILFIQKINPTYVSFLNVFQISINLSVYLFICSSLINIKKQIPIDQARNRHLS